MKQPARWQADAALAFVALVWGSTFVVVKQAVAAIPAMYFLSLRFGLASVCLLALFAAPLRNMPRRELFSGLRAGFVTGIFLWSGYVLQTSGLRYTSAANSGFLTGLYIPLVPVIGALMYRQRPSLSAKGRKGLASPSGGAPDTATVSGQPLAEPRPQGSDKSTPQVIDNNARSIVFSRRELAGVLLATAGMVIMTFPAQGKQFTMNKGDLLTVGCAVAFAFHLLVLGHFSKRERVEAVALGQIASTALISTSALTIFKPRGALSPFVVGVIIVTGVFATALAFALQTWGQKHTTPSRTALIFALEPVFALLTAVAFGEPARWAGVAGGALILAGILAVELKSATPGTSLYTEN